MAQIWRAQVSSGAAIWSQSNGDGDGPSVPFEIVQTAPVAASASVAFSGSFFFSMSTPGIFDLAAPIEMSAAAAVTFSGDFLFGEGVELVQTAPVGAAVAVSFSGDFGFAQGFGLVQTAPVSGALVITISGSFAYRDRPPEFAPGIPRLAFRQRTGELFPLLLDADNVPYAYTRPNGSTVALRPLDSVSLGVAVTEGTGEMLIII